MNDTVVKLEKIQEMKNIAKNIEAIELQLICFGSDSKLEYKQRKLTEKLTNIILKL